MAWRNLIEGHPRNIPTKLFENQPDTFGEEDFSSFHFSHIRQKSPTPWWPCFLTNQYDLKESEVFFRLVAMETRILQGSQIFEGILVRTLRGGFLWSFITIDTLFTEKILTDDAWQTPDKRRSQLLNLSTKPFRWAKIGKLCVNESVNIELSWKHSGKRGNDHEASVLDKGLIVSMLNF